jgi:glycosyltransferase involved in cell wall biosynthesis
VTIWFYETATEGCPHRYAVLAFDGGYRDNVSMALPIRERHNAPFHMYVPTGGPARTLQARWLGLRYATDILVLPSFSETLPMSVIEALAHGVAIICAPGGALPDIIEHERTGLIVKPGDVEDIASALSRLTEGPDLRRHLGKGGKALHRTRLAIDVCAERPEAISAESVHAGEPRHAYIARY